MKLTSGINSTKSICLAVFGLALVFGVKQDIAVKSDYFTFSGPETIESNAGNGNWRARTGENPQFSVSTSPLNQNIKKLYFQNFLSPQFPEKASKQTSKNDDVNAKLVAANTRFSFKLFSQLLKEKTNENIFISPASIGMSLGMTYNGASGNTQQAIAQTLELQGISLQEINQANAVLKTNLQNSDPKIQISIVNSIWTNKKDTFKQDFIQNIQAFYKGEVKNLNFRDPSAVSIINDWVKRSTNGKIDTIVQQIEPDTVFVLLNAIYFLGTWKYPFPKEATKEHQFTLLNGSKKQVTTMFQQISSVKYYENDIFQAIALPYGDGRLSMYIFLPNQNLGLKGFYQNLNSENWEKWMNRFHTDDTESDYSQAILLGLPRFKIDYQIDLQDTLKAMGMEIAFGGGADFSAMIPPPLSLGKFTHKSFVEVNEEGTQAAAVTVAGGTRGGAVQMIVDRPFFCVIRDNRTGTILFMGSVVEPK